MNPNIKASFKSLLHGAWEATVGERLRALLFVVLFVIAYTLDLLSPFAIGWTLNVVTQKGVTAESFPQVLLGIGAYTGLRLAYTVLHHLARYLQTRVAYSARIYTLNKIFGTVLDFPLRWHIQHHSGENLSKLHRSVGAVDGVVGTYVWQIIEGTVKVVFAGVAIFALDFKIAATVLVLSVLTICSMTFFNRKLTEKFRRNNIFGNKLNRILVDYLLNIVTVKTLSIENPAKKHLSRQRSEGLALSQKIAKYMELKWGSTSVGYALVIGISLLIYFYDHRGTEISNEVGQVYVLLNLLDRVFQAIGSFTGYYSALIEASTAYEDATQLYTESSVIPVKQTAGALNRSWNWVSLKNLDFTYVSGDRVGLNHVEFEFKRGQKIAIVGQSGSGKSTLLKVLAGLISPDSYTLSTDLQPSIDLDYFTRTTLLIPQEPEIFSESVIYNLTLGEEFDQREISFFVSLCKLDLLLGKLPNGWESNLAEKGLNLSVGEKQRLALARGLLRTGSKDILLLDEPTSSLDPKTEKDIYLGLLYHFTDRCVFSSCHRLNLIPLFDKIVYMAHSSVLEVGSFSELIEKRGFFFKAWEDYERNIRNVAPKSAEAEEGSS